MYLKRQSRGQSHLVCLPPVDSNFVFCFSFAHVRTPRWEGGDGPRDRVRGKSVLTGPDTMLDGWTAPFSPANIPKCYRLLAPWVRERCAVTCAFRGWHRLARSMIGRATLSWLLVEMSWLSQPLTSVPRRSCDEFTIR